MIQNQQLKYIIVLCILHHASSSAFLGKVTFMERLLGVIWDILVRVQTQFAVEVKSQKG